MRSIHDPCVNQRFAVSRSHASGLSRNLQISVCQKLGENYPIATTLIFIFKSLASGWLLTYCKNRRASFWRGISIVETVFSVRSSNACIVSVACCLLEEARILRQAV